MTMTMTCRGELQCVQFDEVNFFLTLNLLLKLLGLVVQQKNKKNLIDGFNGLIDLYDAAGT